MNKKTGIHSWQFWLSKFLWITVIISAISSIFVENWWIFFMSLVTLALMITPSILQRSIAVRLPITFEIIFFTFIYASVFLGNVQNYYNKFEWWDTLMHSISGFLIGFVGFTIMFIFFSQKKIKASPSLISVFSFSLAMSMGAIWEIYEYLMDITFGLSMQGNGLPDTMEDLMLDAGGALVIAILGYIYLKFKNQGFIQRMLKDFLQENPQYK